MTLPSRARFNSRTETSALADKECQKRRDLLRQTQDYVRRILDAFDSERVNPVAGTANESSTMPQLAAKDDGTFSDDNIPLCRRRRRKLPIKARKIMGAWFERNRHDPYPSEEVKIDMSEKTGLTIKQIQQWFTNRRKRDSRWRSSQGIYSGGKRSTSSSPTYREPLFRGGTRSRPNKRRRLKFD